MAQWLLISTSFPTIITNIMELPLAFREQIRPLLSSAEYEEFIQSLQSNAPTSIRINQQKSTHIIAPHIPIDWCETGKYLVDRPAFTFDPLFHAGCYYVQEASSMFIEQVIK